MCCALTNRNREAPRDKFPGAFSFFGEGVGAWGATPATMVSSMANERQILVDAPQELAQRLMEGLQRERIVPRFVDSYVVEHGRHALQVHASLYRDRLELLEREAL